MDGGWQDKAGVIHVHSRFSDGAGMPASIAQAAARAGAQFVVLADHDTLAPLREGLEGWHGPVLLLIGTELSPDSGNHYLAVGIDREVPKDGPPQRYIDAVASQGGLGFIAHPDYPPPGQYPLKPFPWTDWTAEGFTGIEIWTYSVDWLTGVTSPWRLVQALLFPERFVDGPFPETLARWDELCRAQWAKGRRVVGIGSQDAHGILYSYRRMFRTIRTHILIAWDWRGDAKKDKALVLEALGAGRAYVAYDGLRDATGFRFWAEQGSRQAPMGGIINRKDGAGVWLRVRAPIPCRLTLRSSDGVLIEAESDALDHRVAAAGVYRVEARLASPRGWRPWVFANPIYVR
ncbi:MAG: CehA/McbA family metallohydrolase [Firmicutes bacterium]|nr:CehA/McbA family metallohydrolase [Bacillota bacterium]